MYKIPEGNKVALAPARLEDAVVQLGPLQRKFAEPTVREAKSPTEEKPGDFGRFCVDGKSPDLRGARFGTR
jgi:hypothetical protein